jgi:nucleotide-binding universal stress UspA family protein
MVSKILVPSDGTAAANVALPLARAVAQATGARITLMRVIETAARTPTREGFVEAEQTLRRIAAELSESTPNVATVVVGANDIAEAIVQQARSEQADR